MNDTGELRVVVSGPMADIVTANLGICKALRHEFQDALQLVLTLWGCEDASSYRIELENRPVVAIGQLDKCEVWRKAKGGSRKPK